MSNSEIEFKLKTGVAPSRPVNESPRWLSILRSKKSSLKMFAAALLILLALSFGIAFAFSEISSGNYSISLNASDNPEGSEGDGSSARASSLSPLLPIIDFISHSLMAVRGEIIDISAKLSYENKSPLPGEMVYFYAYPKMNAAEMMPLGNSATDTMGVATFAFNTAVMKAGSYNVNASFDGNEGIKPASGEASIDILEKQVKEGIVLFGISPEWNIADAFVRVSIGNETRDRALSECISGGLVIVDIKSFNIAGKSDAYVDVIVDGIVAVSARLPFEQKEEPKKLRVSKKIRNARNEIVSASIEFFDANGTPISLPPFAHEKKHTSNEMQDLASDEDIVVDSGIYGIKIRPERMPVKEIMFNNVMLEENSSRFVNIDDAPETGSFVEVYAIDPSAMKFTDAIATVNAKGNQLYKCKEWNFSEQACKGRWVF